MSKTFKAGIVLSTLLTILSANSHAAEENAGTLHFTGEIIEPSCTIEGDSGTDSTIPLGTYPTSLFSEVGTESTLVPFSVTLIDCPLKSDGLPSVQLTFNGTSALTGSTTLLDVSKITTPGDVAATGVGIAISPDGKDTQLISIDGTEDQVFLQLPTKETDKIKANFNGRYKSFSEEVTAGAADGDLVVNILYR